MTVVAALVAALAGVAGAQVEDHRSSTTRVRLTGFIGMFSSRTGMVVDANPGDRIVSLVSPGEGAYIDLRLERSTNGGVTWKTIADDWGGVVTYTRKIDHTVIVPARYRTRITTGLSSGQFIFSTDRTPFGAPAATGLADTCFGAIGPSCNFWPSPGECIRSLTGTLNCRTSVGSQKHDTCCSHHPGGSVCSLNLPSDGAVCNDEWWIAWADVFGNRFWRLVYDPTHVSYSTSFRVSTANPFNFADAVAIPQSMRAPVGTVIRSVDAQQGYCVEPCHGAGPVWGETTCLKCGDSGDWCDEHPGAPACEL
jgi:hypothetical protein